MRYFKSGGHESAPGTPHSPLNGPNAADVSTEYANREGHSPAEFRDDPVSRRKLRELLRAKNGEEID